VEELIKLNPRYELQLEVLKQEYGIKLLEVYPREKLNLCRMAIMPEEQNLQMQVTGLLKSWKILSMKCVYKFLDSFRKNGCDVQLFCRIRKWKNFFVVELNGATERTYTYL
jgi:hypothetical protein